MSLRLAPRKRRAVDATLVTVLVTGLVWLATDRDDTSDALRAVLRNDARLHAAAGLAVVYLAGTLWLAHVRRAWHSRRNRVAGSLTFALVALLVATGYALGYLGGDASRLWIARTHWIGGLACALAYVAHRVRGAATRPPT